MHGQDLPEIRNWRWKGSLVWAKRLRTDHDNGRHGGQAFDLAAGECGHARRPGTQTNPELRALFHPQDLEIDPCIR